LDARERERGESYLPNRLNWAGEDLGCRITVKAFLNIARNIPVLPLSQKCG